jgi:MFS family permease
LSASANSTDRLYRRFFATSPLRHAQFRRFYCGSVSVALGYTMQATIAAWLMATLTPSAIMVALVQTASTLPTLLFGLHAGALADIVDRRRIVLTTLWLLIAVTALIGAAELSGVLGPAALLAGTFLIGLGFTFYLPAQQSNINELVERQDLPRAVGLGALSFNLSRAIGPALAGAVAAWLGSGSAFLASALFFGVMIYVVQGWQRKAPGLPGVRDTLVSAIRSGLRFARHSPPMRALLIKSFCFTICASAFWALLPLIARDQLGLDAGGFGMLSASFGMGAIVAALTVPRQLHRLSLNVVVSWGFVLWTAATLLLVVTDSVPAAVVGAATAGVAWVVVLPSLSGGVQSTAPAWVRARSVAMSLVVMQASLAVGSVIWGWVASFAGIDVALAASAGVMLFLLTVTFRVRVRMGEEGDVTPGMALPDMVINAAEPMPDDGPVVIQVEYRIEAGERERFLDAIHEIEPIRRRNGASDWRVFRDLGEEGRFVERFIVSSWAEYVRLRSRMTVADRQVQDLVEKFLKPGAQLEVTRLISAR